jgi:hypothetical protein
MELSTDAVATLELSGDHARVFIRAVWYSIFFTFTCTNNTSSSNIHQNAAQKLGTSSTVMCLLTNSLNFFKIFLKVTLHTMMRN